MIRSFQRASLVSLDRLFIYLYRRCVGRGTPHHHEFLGGLSKWHQPLPVGGCLHTLFSFPLFLGTIRSCLPPFSARPWKEGLSFCPVETVRLIPFWTLQPSFAAFLLCLLQAGIQVTSGSTCLVAASALLVRGAPLGAVLQLGNWGSAPALCRFCHALYGLFGRHEFPRLRLLTSALGHLWNMDVDINRFIYGLLLFHSGCRNPNRPSIPS
jgi:hypothetical protein